MLFYTGARFEELVRRTGAHFVPYPAEVDYDDRDLNASFPKRAGLSAIDRFNFDLRHIFAEPAPVHDKRFQELLADFPATAVIHDFGSLGILPMALRAPRGSRPVLVNISMSPPVFDSADTAPYGPGLPPPTTDEERARYDEMRHQTQAMFADGHRTVVDAFAAMGITLTDTIFNASARIPDHTLQLTVPEFEYPRGDAPEGFRFIGPIPPAPDAGFEPPAWWHDLSSGRPVIVVTQGTVANDDLTDLVLPTLRALADMDVTVVTATARPDGPAHLQSDPVPAVVRF